MSQYISTLGYPSYPYLSGALLLTRAFCWFCIDDSLSRRSNSSHSTSGCSSMVPPSGGSTEPRQDTKRRRSSGESGMSRGTQTQPASQEHKRARCKSVITNVQKELLRYPRRWQNVQVFIMGKALTGELSCPMTVFSPKLPKALDKDGS